MDIITHSEGGFGIVGKDKGMQKERMALLNQSSKTSFQVASENNSDLVILAA